MKKIIVPTTFTWALALSLTSLGGCGESQNSMQNAEELPLDMQQSQATNSKNMRIFSSINLTKTDWIEAFEVVIVVDKSAIGPDAQKLLAYQNGMPIITSLISTGREQSEKAGKDGPVRDYISVTPVGYYSPYLLAEKYVSKLWKSSMPYAVFFNNGIALHEAPKNAVDKIGMRASGGCVRLPPDVAPQIFNLVKSTAGKSVPQFTRWGDAVLDDQNQLKFKTGYSTLIIVQQP